ncbi:MAG: 5'-methylthioadenosine/S-adenosylhomocysteine nucleosidase, partial [Deltaproteobacteria bacterium]|nr:5'-methylthioadenosine/S-adenosylhomocysteine nucleosidase [Deltaproteobacteria bacterium]
MNNSSRTLVGIICALGREAKGIAEYLIDKKWDALAGRTILHGFLDGRRVTILNSGVGKTRAASGTQLLIDRYHPRYIINFGTAGGIDDSLRVKDVVVSTRAVMYDTDHKDPEKTIFHAAPELLELGRDLPGIHQGVICTADRVVSSDSVRTKLAYEYQALCADWEGAAILEVCKLNGSPGLILKVISDKAGPYARLEFLFYHKVAIARGAAVLTQLISKIPLAERMENKGERKKEVFP